MRQRFIPLYLFIYILLLGSCTETTDTIGTSLTDIERTFSETAATYPITSRSVKSFNVFSRGRNGYLGKAKDLETDCYLTCNYMTQMRTIGMHQFPDVMSVNIDPAKYNPAIERWKQVEADSCWLELYVLSSVGDSLSPMKVSVREMSEPYEEGVTYYVDFDPEALNMIRTGKGTVNSYMTYTTSNHIFSDAERAKANFTNYISIGLNDSIYDKNDPTVKYNNYGTYLMRKFYDPATHENFLNQYKFTHNICPGFYIKHAGGIGNIATIYAARLVVAYVGVVQEQPLYSGFGGTEEVIQKSSLSQSDTELQKLLDNNTCTYIKSPAGIWTELELPVEDIMNGHENDTLNTARVFIPRINNEYINEYAFNVPKNILMIPTDSISDFFDNQKVANFRNTYIATYGSKTNGYTFNNISILISNLYRKKQAGNVSPNWNKVTLIPVETTYSTVSTSATQVLTKVTHDMSMSSTRLMKDGLQISVIYSHK